MLSFISRYVDSADNTAVSKDVQAVKLCTNKILQFLTGGVG